MTAKASIFVLAMMVLGGCHNTEKCEKARFAAKEAWQSAKDTASRRKISTGPEMENKSDEQKKQHVDVWGAFEKDADLLYSSFLTDQITWESAEATRKKLDAAFKTYESQQGADEGFVKGFRMLLDNASHAQDDAKAVCR